MGGYILGTCAHCKREDIPTYYYLGLSLCGECHATAQKVDMLQRKEQALMQSEDLDE